MGTIEIVIISFLVGVIVGLIGAGVADYLAHSKTPKD